MKLKDIKVGDIVVLNCLKDAVKWEIISIDGFNVELKEAGTDYKTQFIDVCYICKKVK